MPTPQYYDYPAAARAAGLSVRDLEAIIRHFEAEYPVDLMLRELHILRACNAIARGVTSAAQILSPAPRGNVA